jgi:hypothetical protein
MTARTQKHQLELCEPSAAGTSALLHSRGHDRSRFGVGGVADDAVVGKVAESRVSEATCGGVAAGRLLIVMALRLSMGSTKPAWSVVGR